MGSQVNRTSYNAPNVNVDTSGPGGAGLDVDPFFMNMAKRRMRLEAEQAAMRNQGMRFDLGKKLKDESFTDRPRFDMQDERESAAQRSRGRVYEQRLQEADINPGKKMIGGFNINPGYIEDTTLLPVSMRPKEAKFVPPEENTAGISKRSHGTGGYDPVAAEEAARGDLAGPGGGADLDRGLLQMSAEEDMRKRLLKAQAQQQYFSGRG